MISILNHTFFAKIMFYPTKKSKTPTSLSFSNFKILPILKELSKKDLEMVPSFKLSLINISFINKYSFGVSPSYLLN